MIPRRHASEPYRRADAIQQRSDERRFSETWDVPIHVQRNSLALDDDPELTAYGDFED